MHYAFLYISQLTARLCHDVKSPHYTLYGGLTSNEKIFFFSLNLVIVVSNSAPEDGTIAIDLKELEFTFKPRFRGRHRRGMLNPLLCTAAMGFPWKLSEEPVFIFKVLVSALRLRLQRSQNVYAMCDNPN